MKNNIIKRLEENLIDNSNGSNVHLNKIGIYEISKNNYSIYVSIYPGNKKYNMIDCVQTIANINDNFKIFNNIDGSDYKDNNLRPLPKYFQFIWNKSLKQKVLKYLLN